MTQHLRAGAGALTHAATMVGEAHCDFDTTARSLGARIDGQLAGGWAGSGADAFVALHEAWQRSHARIAAVLDELEGALRATDATFDASDQDATRGVSAVALDRL